MYNIIPLVAIIIALSAIAVIVVRKFSALASLDIETIKAEREAKFKEQIISNRLKRGFFKWRAKFGRASGPLLSGFNRFVSAIYEKLLELKRSYSSPPAPVVNQQIGQLLAEADDFWREKKLTAAEKNLIAVIGLDPKNITAFTKLGRVFVDQKNYGEAIQTFHHALKLIDDADIPPTAEAEQKTPATEPGQRENLRAEIYHDLAEAHHLADEIDDAMAASRRALKIEPENPRYLDTILELCIIKKDKILALDAFEKIKRANPENNKLADWQKAISEL